MARREWNSVHCWTWMVVVFAAFLCSSSTAKFHHPRIARAQRQRKTKTLRIPAGKFSFKIAMFGDLHFGENAWTDWGPLQDVLSTVLDTEKPDFAAYLGDVITANNIAIANESAYWDQAISPAQLVSIHVWVKGYNIC